MKWLHWHVNIRDYRYPHCISVMLLILLTPAFILSYVIAIIHNSELGMDDIRTMLTGDNDYELSFHFNRQKDALRFMRLFNVIGAISYLSET